MHLIFSVTFSGDQENSSDVSNISKTAASYAENRKSVKTKRFDEALLLKRMYRAQGGAPMCFGVGTWDPAALVLFDDGDHMTYADLMIIIHICE